MMRLSVIIPTLNERDAIANCVESALALGVTEVIVVDGGSGDDTPAIAEAAGARVVTSSPGRGQQLNVGAREASGDVLLFLHADNSLLPEAAQQIRDALEAKSVVHGAFRQRIDAEGWRYRWLEAGNAFRARRLNAPYGDQALFVRREAWDRVGGFPNEPLMEDVAIARRLRALGRPVLLDGPLHVSPRRWKTNGVVRTTITNWFLLIAWTIGVPPRRLVKWYYRTPPIAANEPTSGDSIDEALPPIGAVTQSGR